MARLPRIRLSGVPQHIIQRGNNRQACFASEKDFAAYAHWLEKFSRKYRVAIHAWVFMTNHAHLLATPETEGGVSRMMQALGREYVRYFNYTYQRTGTLWEGRFKSCAVDAETYLLICQRYIELNPVRAGLVQAPEDYRWSSFKANALGERISMWSPHRVYNALGKSAGERSRAYYALFAGQLETDVLRQIRQTSNQGMVLGSEKFKQEIARLADRRVVPLRRGPKRRLRNG
jgi:putative transposase